MYRVGAISMRIPVAPAAGIPARDGKGCRRKPPRSSLMRLCLRSDTTAPAPLRAGGSASRPSRGPLAKRHLLASATFLLATASFPGFAAEWFVSTAGNDSTGTGTQQKPFRTIKRALSSSVSSAGDTVTVRGPAGNATYNECEVRLRHRLVLRTYPGERAR